MLSLIMVASFEPIKISSKLLSDMKKRKPCKHTGSYYALGWHNIQAARLALNILNNINLKCNNAVLFKCKYTTQRLFEFWGVLVLNLLYLKELNIFTKNITYSDVIYPEDGITMVSVISK